MEAFDYQRRFKDCRDKTELQEASRYGLIAYASSFDCPGILTRNVCDAAITLAIMQGADPKDGQAVEEDGRISSVATELISESQMNFKEWLEAGKSKGENNSSSDTVLPLLGVHVGIPGEFSSKKRPRRDGKLDEVYRSVRRIRRQLFRYLYRPSN